MRRREFLTAGAVSATVAVAAAARASAPLHAPQELRFSRDQFLAWRHEQFRVTAYGALRAHQATLVAVEDGPVHPGLQQFRVSFQGAAGLPTGLCLLEHAGGARFSLHLEAVPDAGATRASRGVLRRATFGLLED